MRERAFGSLKYEHLYRCEIETLQDLAREAEAYRQVFNHIRPHRALRLQPPRSDRPVVDLTHERIRRRPVLEGLITQYKRAA